MLAAGQGPSLPELEGMLRRLTAQRDSAQAAAADAQAKLGERQAEVQALQQQVQRLEQQAAAAVAGEPSGCPSWPSGLSRPESLAEAAPPATGELTAVQAALDAERQQSGQLQAALHALTADMQRLQQQQQQQLAVVPAAGALADVTNTRQPQQAEVQRLAKLVARAQARLRHLAAENERLMEVSNSLHAERGRLELAAGGASDAGEAAAQLPPPLPLAPAPGLLLPPSLWPLLAPTAVGQFAAASSSGCGTGTADRGSQQPPQPPAGQQQQPAQQQAVQQQQPLPQQQQEQQDSERVHAAAGDEQLPGATMPQSLAVVGVQLPGHDRPAAAPRANGSGSSGSGTRQQAQQEAGERGGAAPAKPKVRNYNIRD